MKESTKSVFKQRLQSIRAAMLEQGFDAYQLTRTDPHQSEYLPEYWEQVAWLTGFTGSAAVVVITKDFAGLWTDSRYFLQAEAQLEDTGFELMKLKIPHTPEYIEWLLENLEVGSTLGMDGRLMARSRFAMTKDNLSPKNIKIRFVADLIAPLWEDRPAFPFERVFEHRVRFCGYRRTEKIQQVRKEMVKLGIDRYIISTLDDIAWLFNIRGRDALFSPLVISYAVLSMDEAFLFVHESKMPEAGLKAFEEDEIKVLSYTDITKVVSRFPAGSRVLLDFKRSSQYLYSSIPENCIVRDHLNITTLLKAIKNPIELKNIRQSMMKDGVVMCRFLRWLESNIGKMKITEVSVAEKIEALRKEQLNYHGPSFATIAGYKEHGAIVHYEASAETDKALQLEGIFLLDTGGQYYDGTTDITRTVSLGNITEAQKRDFTLVLKGHIQLAALKFPLGTTGNQVEAFARQAMWQHGVNYGHGTGHGVGFFLNVHEGPHAFGTGATADPKAYFQPGMLITNEPGIYQSGEYGIRTENIMLVSKAEETNFGFFLKFETITLCPIETSLIALEMLAPEEKQWLNDYHRTVWEKLSPLLNEEEREWLKGKTCRI